MSRKIKKKNVLVVYVTCRGCLRHFGACSCEKNKPADFIGILCFNTNERGREAEKETI